MSNNNLLPLVFALMNKGGAEGGLVFKGSCAFEDLPTSGQAAGDMYNITNDFVLGGKHYVAGTNVAWTGSEWDALGGDTASLFINASSHTTVKGYEVPVLTDTQITNAYNAINAGKNVFIVDDLDTLTMGVIEASSIESPEVSISVLFTDKLVLTYLTGGDITAQVLDYDWDSLANKPFSDLGEGVSSNSSNELVSNFITGSYGKPKILTSVDLNTISNSGIYCCDVCTNRPTENNGVMLVLKNTGASDNVVQIYWTFQADTMWVRHKDLGNWKTWIKTNNLTASDIMATNAQSVQTNLERIDGELGIRQVLINISEFPDELDVDFLYRVDEEFTYGSKTYDEGLYQVVDNDLEKISGGGGGGAVIYDIGRQGQGYYGHQYPMMVGNDWMAINDLLSAGTNIIVKWYDPGSNTNVYFTIYQFGYTYLRAIYYDSYGFMVNLTYSRPLKSRLDDYIIPGFEALGYYQIQINSSHTASGIQSGTITRSGNLGYLNLIIKLAGEKLNTKGIYNRTTDISWLKDGYKIIENSRVKLPLYDIGSNLQSTDEIIFRGYFNIVRYGYHNFYTSIEILNPKEDAVEGTDYNLGVSGSYMIENGVIGF